MCYNEYTMTEVMTQTKTDQGIVHEAVNELRRAYEPVPGLPTDTDIVWVLSAPGTYLQQAPHEKAGIYSQQMHDRNNLLRGFEAVREITAQRLGKKPSEVTFHDIEEKGPILYYNGEGAETAGSNYHQNDDLRKAMKQPDFPFPASKIIIGEIDAANTPAQARGFAKYLHSLKNAGEINKVAVISLTPHAPRAARYIQLEIENGDISKDIEFYGVTVNPETDTLGTGLREVRKVLQYYRKGDLARTPAYTAYYRPLGRKTIYLTMSPPKPSPQKPEKKIISL